MALPGLRVIYLFEDDPLSTNGYQESTADPSIPAPASKGLMTLLFNSKGNQVIFKEVGRGAPYDHFLGTIITVHVT